MNIKKNTKIPFFLYTIYFSTIFLPIYNLNFIFTIYNYHNMAIE